MSSQLCRLIASASITPSAITCASGRKYSGSPGSVLDVPIADAENLGGAGGWMRFPDMSGPTSGRPKANDPDTNAATVGTLYADTTLSKVIIFDGVAWRDPFTGSAV